MWIVDVYVIILGLFIGSFINVVALRLLQHASFVFPPSHCPHCAHRLAALDLIPVISYLLLKGKCRYCQNRISILYPVGELLFAICFYIIFSRVGIQWEILPAIVLALILQIAMLTDLKAKLILDKITFPALVFFAVCRLFIGAEPYLFYVIGGLLGFSLLLFLAWISGGGMGGGDIKLYTVIGVALGPWLTLMSLVFASLLGAVTGLILLLTGKVKRKQTIPFAPFIWGGTLAAYLYGQDLWLWYIDLMVGGLDAFS